MRVRNKMLLGCLLGVAIAVPALAQPASTLSQYPECPNPPPKLSPVEQEAAHASFKVGAEAFKDSDYQKAIDNFKDAFRRDCSKVSLLDFIARSYEGKGDRAEAVHALEVYLQRSPNADDADTIRKRIANLKAQMAPSSGTATAPTTTATTTATATAPTATGTGTAPPPPETGGHTIFPWIVTGVGVVALGVAIPVGVIGAGKQSAAREGCVGSGGVQVCNPPNITPSGQDRSSLSSTGAAMGTTGWILGSVGVAAIAGGLVWHFMEPSAKKTTALAPVIAPGYGGVSFAGTF